MSAVCTCPNCSLQVSIPDEAASTAQVRCPLCQAEYALGEVVRSAPPPLIIVAEETLDEPLAGSTELDIAIPEAELGAAAAVDLADSEADIIPFGEHHQHETPAEDLPIALADDQWLQSSDQLEPVELEEAEEDAHWRLPPDAHDAQAGAISARFGAADLEPPGFEAASAEGLSNSVEEVQFEPAEIDAEEIELEKPLGERFDFGGARSHEYSPTAGRADEGQSEAAAPFAVRPSPRKARRKPSALANLIGIAGGGVLGLGLGYFLLLWIGGPQRDVLNLGSKLPRWMVPASFHASPVNARPARNPFDDPPDRTVARAATDDNAQPALPPLPLNVPKEQAPANNAVADKSQAPDKLEVPDLDTPAAADPFSDTFEPEPPTVPVPAPSAGTDPSKPAPSAGTAPPAAQTGPIEDPFEPKGPVPSPPKEALNPAPSTPPVSPPKADDRAARPDTRRHAGPAGGEKPTAAEFEKVLAEARDASQAMHGAGVADDAKKVKARYFRALFNLAKVVTLVDGDGNLLQPHSRQQIEQLLMSAASSEQKFNEIGTTAGKWFDITKGDAHRGIVLTGTVQKAGQQGALFEVQIALAGGSRTVAVLSADLPQVAASDRVALLGTIVENPSRDLPDYHGGQQRVVWQGVAVKLPAATR